MESQKGPSKQQAPEEIQADRIFQGKIVLPPIIPPSLLYPSDSRLPSFKEVTKNLSLQSDSYLNIDSSVLHAATTLFTMKMEERPETPIHASSDSGVTSPHKFEKQESKQLIALEQEKMWAQFYHFQNEMIITKNGRCLFPILKFSCLDSIDDDEFYSFFVDIVPIVNRKLKYRNRTWSLSLNKNSRTIEKSAYSDEEATSKSNDSYTEVSRQRFGAYNIYMCEEGIQNGSFWKSNGISFQRMKLTNKIRQRSSHADIIDTAFEQFPTLDYHCHVFSLQSFHHFQPRIHVVSHPNITQSVKMPNPRHFPRNIKTCTHIFTQTKFIAVTHYQNQQINALKKVFNPHAKGFKEMIPSRLLPNETDFEVLSPIVTEDYLADCISEGLKGFQFGSFESDSEASDNEPKRIKRNV